MIRQLSLDLWRRDLFGRICLELALTHQKLKKSAQTSQLSRNRSLFMPRMQLRHPLADRQPIDLLNRKSSRFSTASR